MENLRKNICFELKHLKHGRILLALSIVVIVVNVALAFIDYEYVSSMYDAYDDIERYYKENKLDIQGDLSSGTYNLTIGEGGNTTVENPILYHYDSMSKALFAVSPQYAVSHILELSIMVFPLLFAVLGAFLSTYDYKYKVYKHKILRFNRNNYFASKIIVLLLISFTSVISAAFISKVINIPLYKYICNCFPVEKFNVGSPRLLSGIVVQLSSIMLISFLYASVGFCIGTITKSSFITVAIFTIYLYIIPTFSKYDINNCCKGIMKKIFNCYGIVNISVYKSINFYIALTIISGVIIFANFISYLIIKKRSAYI